MAIKIGGLTKSEGMREMSFTLPPGDYLFKATEYEMTEKKDADGVTIGLNFKIKSVVEDAENLPENVTAEDVRGKSFTDFIFVMTPDHPKYANTTQSGGTIGEIGIDTLKSFLAACSIPIKKDQFNEKRIVGSEFVASIGTREYTKKDGSKGVGNRVYTYKPFEETEEEEEVAEIEEDEAVEAEVDAVEADDLDDLDDDFLDDDLE